MRSCRRVPQIRALRVSTYTEYRQLRDFFGTLRFIGVIISFPRDESETIRLPHVRESIGDFCVRAAIKISKGLVFCGRCPNTLSACGQYVYYGDTRARAAPRPRCACFMHYTPYLPRDAGGQMRKWTRATPAYPPRGSRSISESPLIPLIPVR